MLHKEDTESDSVSVAWNIPTTAGLPGEARKVITAQYLSATPTASESIYLPVVTR